MANYQQLPDHLKERYGVGKNRWQQIVSVIIILLSIIGLVVFTKIKSDSPSTSGELIKFKVNSPTEVDVVWKIQRPTDRASYCAVRAQDLAQTDVGYAIVKIAPGEKLLTTSYQLATNGKAALVEILGCGDSAQLRVPPPNFPPGVQIPQQQRPGIAPSP
ncbi:MAG: DUF4307 domain-containing protein [Actinomycetales bacterium]|nr:DUF4307 domain-containing protein [Actinomycetales bacterium]